MAYNFKPYDVNQLYLLPQDMRDWLPQGHLVWFVIDLVCQMDLSDFYKEYNERGEGRAAYDPKMMVALYLYAYCNKVRSSREIERLCVESVPFRVISGVDFPRFSGHQLKSLLLDFYMFSQIPLKFVAKGRMQLNAVVEYLNILECFDPGF